MEAGSRKTVGSEAVKRYIQTEADPDYTTEQVEYDIPVQSFRTDEDGYPEEDDLYEVVSRAVKERDAVSQFDTSDDGYMYPYEDVEDTVYESLWLYLLKQDLDYESTYTVSGTATLTFSYYLYNEGRKDVYIEDVRLVKTDLDVTLRKAQ